MEPESAEDPALAVAARHALHDEELIAAYATDGEAADDAGRARSFIERCSMCRDLHADLVAIGAAVRSTGPAVRTAAAASAVAETERAPRDFRLSVETANRLRPGSVTLRLGDRIRDGIAAFSRPVGMSMASLGIVGLLLGTLTLGGFTNLAGAPQDMGSSAGGAPPGNGSEGTPPTGEITGPASFPRETLRLATLQIDSSKGPATLAPATDAPVPTAPAATGPVAPTGAGQAPGGGSTLAAVILGGSAILLVGGIALLVLGARQRREPLPGR